MALRLLYGEQSRISAQASTTNLRINSHSGALPPLAAKPDGEDHWFGSGGFAMLRAGIVALALMLSGCASSIMNGYVGKPVESVMARYGPPANTFDMPDGRRAFQWQIDSSFVMPGMAQTNTNIFAPPGSFAQVNSYTTYTPAQQINSSCLYTMYGQYQNNMWVLVGYEKPNLMCQ